MNTVLSAQTRLDSLKILNAKDFKSPEIKPEGLKHFKLEIQPMKLIEPEIYLFGPSDLLPGYEYDFKPESKFRLSLSGGNSGLADEEMNIIFSNDSYWLSINQGLHLFGYQSSRTKTGSFDFTIGNQQFRQSSGSGLLYQMNIELENRIYQNQDSLQFSLADRNLTTGKISFEIKSNRLVENDFWTTGLSFSNLNSSHFYLPNVNFVQFNGEYNKDLSFGNGFLKSEWVAVNRQVDQNVRSMGNEIKNYVSVQAGLEFNGEQFSSGFSSGSILENLKANSENLIFDATLKWDTRYFHHQLLYHNRRNQTVSKVQSAHFYWIDSKLPVTENSVAFSPDFPIQKYRQEMEYTLEWIPSVNWIFKSRIKSFQIEIAGFDFTDSLLVQNKSFLNIEGSVSFYLTPLKKVSAEISQSSYKKSSAGNTLIPFLPESKIIVSMDITGENQKNRFILSGTYGFNRFRNFQSSREKLNDFSEIYSRFEDFHWNPVKIFSELRLYLNEEMIYPGLNFEKFYLSAGISLEF